MTATSTRWFGAGVGVLTMVVAGLLTGQWWWVAAAVGVLAATGSIADRQLAHAHALATLALAVGLAVESHGWFLPLLVAGTIASIELGAAADRTTIIRPRVLDLRDVAATSAASAALAAAVFAVGFVPAVAAAGGVLVAAAAGVLATRVIAR